MIKLLKQLRLQEYYLKGKLYLTMKCKDSNLYKFFEVVNSVFNDTIDRINHLYYSIYPCLGIQLLKEHELELGIPDSIFNIDKTMFAFTYNFPIPFFDTSIFIKGYNPISIRQKDLFVKKYLMNDNSIEGFKKIAGCYGYSIKIEKESNKSNIMFDYEFPICFNCKLEDKTYKITVYGNPNIIMVKKLYSIYNYIKRIDVKLIIIGDKNNNIYNPKDYCICKNF